MEIILTFFVILFIASTVAIVYSSSNAKQGNLIPLTFRYISGIPNLKEGEIIKISSNNEKININDKYFISKDKVISKNITDSRMLTEKQKSVIQRSLVGLAVGGGLGAIIGGISGVGTKQVTELVHFLNIDYKDENDIEQSAIFSLEDKSHLMYVNMFVNS